VIERAQPGSIMSGYNKINGEYASGNHHLLNEVLKGAWGYQGYVMSDWRRGVAPMRMGCSSRAPCCRSSSRLWRLK
jgi:beta-glucosidase-like glycosyl hydrolase